MVVLVIRGYSPYIIVPTSKNGTDWYKEITRNAPIQNHNVAMSGATESSRFLLSLNYFDQDGDHYIIIFTNDIPSV